MTKVTISPLPIYYRATDYHEFDDIQNTLQMLVPEIKAKEIGFDGYYLGMIYIGKLTDPDNAKMVKIIKTQTKEWEKQNP